MIYCQNCNIEIPEGLERCPSCLFPHPGSRQSVVEDAPKQGDVKQEAPAVQETETGPVADPPTVNQMFPNANAVDGEVK